MFNVFIDLAKYPGDVRREITRFGRETCATRFNEQQMQKMQFIQNQRSSGLGGMMSGLNRPPIAGGMDQQMKFGSDLKKNE